MGWLSKKSEQASERLAEAKEKYRRDSAERAKERAEQKAIRIEQKREKAREEAEFKREVASEYKQAKLEAAKKAARTRASKEYDTRTGVKKPTGFWASLNKTIVASPRGRPSQTRKRISSFKKTKKKKTTSTRRRVTKKKKTSNGFDVFSMGAPRYPW